MARKKFIDKQNSQTFHVIHRAVKSNDDENDNANNNDSTNDKSTESTDQSTTKKSEYFLQPSHRGANAQQLSHSSAFPSELLDFNADSSEADYWRRHDRRMRRLAAAARNDRTLLPHEYDYSAHLRPIDGSGTFVAAPQFQKDERHNSNARYVARTSAESSLESQQRREIDTRLQTRIERLQRRQSRHQHTTDAALKMDRDMRRVLEDELDIRRQRTILDSSNQQKRSKMSSNQNQLYDYESLLPQITRQKLEQQIQSATSKSPASATDSDGFIHVDDANSASASAAAATLSNSTAATKSTSSAGVVDDEFDVIDAVDDCEMFEELNDDFVIRAMEGDDDDDSELSADENNSEFDSEGEESMLSHSALAHHTAAAAAAGASTEQFKYDDDDDEYKCEVSSPHKDVDENLYDFDDQHSTTQQMRHSQRQRHTSHDVDVHSEDTCSLNTAQRAERLIDRQFDDLLATFDSNSEDEFDEDEVDDEQSTTTSQQQQQQVNAIDRGEGAFVARRAFELKSTSHSDVVDEFVDRSEKLISEGGAKVEIEPTESELRQQISQQLQRIAHDEEVEGDSVDALNHKLDAMFRRTNKEPEFDCESIISTYTNKENHPQLIREVRVNKRMQQQIPLNAKTGLPILNEHRNDDDDDEHSNFDDDEEASDDNESVCTNTIGVNKGERRPIVETAEEKKARKQAAKALQREQRQRKKQVKSVYLAVQAATTADELRNKQNNPKGKKL